MESKKSIQNIFYLQKKIDTKKAFFIYKIKIDTDMKSKLLVTKREEGG